MSKRWLWLASLVGALALVALALLVPDKRAVPLFTAVLVMVTAWYAWQTQEMAREMRAARGAQVLPKPALSVDLLGPHDLAVRIANAGPGSAIGLDVRLRFEPEGTESRFVAPVFAPGETQSLFFRRADGGTASKLDEIEERFRVVSLGGTCRDALGQAIPVSDRLDMVEYISALRGGLWASAPPPLERIAKTLEKIEKKNPL